MHVPGAHSASPLHTCSFAAQVAAQVVPKPAPPPTPMQHLSPPVHDAAPVHVRPVAASGRFTGVIPASRPRAALLLLALLPVGAVLLATPVLPAGHWVPLAQANVVVPPAVVWQQTSDDVHAAVPQMTASVLPPVLPSPAPSSVPEL
jgi:hypothetical protein